jgi:hypothetical protein
MKSLFFQITYISIFFISISACAPKPKTSSTKINFKLPERNFNSQNYAASLAVDVFDCYAIIVNWDRQNGYCDGKNGTTLFYANEVFGSFKAGNEITIDVTSGEARIFRLIGLTSVNGICPDFKKYPLNLRNTSLLPAVLGQTKANLLEETAIVTIDISYVEGVNESISDCRKLPFEWPKSNYALWDADKWDQGTWAP